MNQLLEDLRHRKIAIEQELKKITAIIEMVDEDPDMLKALELIRDLRSII